MKNHLLKYRTELGLTQKELSEKAGITDRYYRYVETGSKQPTVPIANKLAEALGKTVEQLFK